MRAPVTTEVKSKIYLKEKFPLLFVAKGPMKSAAAASKR